MVGHQTKELYSSKYSSDNTCGNLLGDMESRCLHKPPEYWLKINIDGSKDAEGNSGIGGICRDHRGKVTMVFASSIGRTSSNMAGASVALAGVEWCSRNGCNNIILECDSHLKVDLINGKSKPPWQMQGIIRQIQDIAGQLNYVIRHCYREAN
ncbi:uncharacterized protein [Nicotiana tomentosiformis]|uniref:uncharacterized protein n=1 Tax=Nicotiana tomentosiformis TaxID=4098 RepID=UPI00388C46B6